MSSNDQQLDLGHAFAYGTIQYRIGRGLPRISDERAMVAEILRLRAALAMPQPEPIGWAIMRPSRDSDGVCDQIDEAYGFLADALDDMANVGALYGSARVVALVPVEVES